MSKLVLLACFLLGFGTASGQRDSTLLPPPVDSVGVDSLVSLRAINRGPKRALLWSIIPGGGQVYNRRWWKVPVVYTGLLGAIASLDFNQTRYVRLVDALEARCLGEGNVVEFPFAECQPREDEFPGVQTASLVSARDNADRARQSAYAIILGVYLFQGIEAFVDAHLQDFDISDDLSLRVGPVSVPGAVAGAGVTVRAGDFGRARQLAEVRRLEGLRGR